MLVQCLHGCSPYSCMTWVTRESKPSTTSQGPSSRSIRRVSQSSCDGQPVQLGAQHEFFTPGRFFVKQFAGKAEEDNDKLAFSTSLSNGRPKREGKPRAARILTERRNPVISNVVLIECTQKLGTVHGVTIQNCKYICFSFYISKKWYITLV